jgi:hypothetical protein
MEDVYINVYYTDRAYGGPEEGGWWYTWGKIERSYRTPAHLAEQVRAHLEREVAELNEGTPDIHSVLSQGRYVVYVEDHAGENFPQHKPYYE